jgi:dienelactone hydrolase
MTANAYVPDRPGKVPAVLCVHGHWRGAKQDPTVQARCLGLVKLGIFVLAVDAFGAGERGLGKALGEYHGEMVGATLFPIGLPLCGLQVYENGRAVDYLLSRPEVDGRHLGVTGASGGGNQTMYAGAWDDRLTAVVPVCSVGNYQSYLHAACCMCEVVPGALQFTEEWGILGLTAPRALMVVNATRDGIQFSVAEARKSLALAGPIFSLYGHPDHLRHTIFESRHDYNQAMREAMYGWMMRWLAGKGDGSPVPEPKFQAEDPETLRCFPGQSRPDDFVTIPRFAAAEARTLLRRHKKPAETTAWHTQRAALVGGLKKSLFGGEAPVPKPKLILGEGFRSWRSLTFQPEAPLWLTANWSHTDGKSGKLAILLDLDGAKKVQVSPLAETLRRRGWSVLTLDLRATGSLAHPGDTIGRAPDHNTAEWSLWLGRPLLGQWVVDVRCLLESLKMQDGKLPPEILLAGVGPAGLVALCTAALDERITQVATLETLTTYVTDEPYRGQRLALMVPGILRDAGDIPHLAALVAPRRLVAAGGVLPAGRPLDAAQLRDAFAFTRAVYDVERAAENCYVLPDANPGDVVAKLK